MESFLQILSTIINLETLTTMKEQLKNQVKENMTWQTRMELYKQIQLINERIEELKVTS